MKLKMVTALFATLLAANMAKAVDSYLYWMVGENVTYQQNNSAVAWDYAKVKQGDNYLNWYAGYPSATAVTDSLRSDNAGESLYWGVVDASDQASTFMFELWADADSSNPVGYLSATYADLKNFITDAYGKTPANGAYSLTQVVPEPTSGLLMLFGLAGLALRRKRRV